MPTSVPTRILVAPSGFKESLSPEGVCQAVAAGVGHGHELHALSGADDPGVVASHGAQADEAHAQRVVRRALVGEVVDLGQRSGGLPVESDVLTHVRHLP